jgi:hypothetical protein
VPFLRRWENVFMTSPENLLTECGLSFRAAKLWPHRKHEANPVVGLLCRAGLHRWRRLDLSELMPHKDVLHCFRCPKVKIDGTGYDV